MEEEKPDNPAILTAVLTTGLILGVLGILLMLR